jgi:hypothetical protein
VQTRGDREAPRRGLILHAGESVADAFSRFANALRVRRFSEFRQAASVYLSRGLRTDEPQDPIAPATHLTRREREYLRRLQASLNRR